MNAIGVKLTRSFKTKKKKKKEQVKFIIILYEIYRPVFPTDIVPGCFLFFVFPIESVVIFSIKKIGWLLAFLSIKKKKNLKKKTEQVIELTALISGAQKHVIHEINKE